MDTYINNKYIKMAVSDVYKYQEMKAFYLLLEVLAKRITEGGEAPTPMVISEGQFPIPQIPRDSDIEEIRNNLVGKEFTLDQDLKLNIDTMLDQDGNQWIPLFTSDEELNKGETTNIIMNISIERILAAGLKKDISGVVINPFGQYLEIPKDAIEMMFDNLFGE